MLTYYRLISQLLIISNIMVRIESRQLIYYLEATNVKPFHSAYRKLYYSETALNHITDMLYNSLDYSRCA